MSDRQDASSDMMEHCMQYQEDALSDLYLGYDKAQEDADEVAVRVAFLNQGHTIKEWFLLKDDLDAYIEFLESLLEE